MNSNENLRQQLWEMVYGLLDPEEDAALRLQIKSDPAVARLYAEVRLQADLVSSAAQVEESPLHISAGPASVAKEHRGSSRPASSSPHSGGRSSFPASRGSYTNWLAVGGTTALLLLLGCALLWPTLQTPTVAIVEPSAEEHFVTAVRVPPDLTEGQTRAIEIETRDLQDRGHPAELDLRLVDAAGRETFRRKLSTGESGRAQVELPGASLRPGVKLQVNSTGNDSAPGVAAELPLVPEPRRTLVLRDKPRAMEGEALNFSAVSVREFSKETELPIALPTVETDQQALPYSVDASTGVVNGVVQWRGQKGPSVQAKAMAEKQSAQQESGTPRAKRSEDALAVENNAFPKEKMGSDAQRGLDRAGTEPPAGTAAGLGGGQAPGGSLQARNQSLAQSYAAGNRPVESGQLADAAPADSSMKKSQAGDPSAALPEAEGALAPPSPAHQFGASPARPSMANRGGRPSPATAAAARSPAFVPPANDAMRKRLLKSNDLKSDGVPSDAASAPENPPPAPAPASAMRNTPADLPAAPPTAAPAAPAPAPAPATKPELAPAPPQAKQPNAELRGPEQAKAAERLTIPAPLLSQAGQEQQESKAVARFHLPETFRERLIESPLTMVARRGDTVVLRKELSSDIPHDRLLDALPPEIDGVLDVDVYASPESDEPLYRQRVVRPPTRLLKLAVEGLQKSYAPGELVKLQVQVTDEAGRPTAAAVGVRVWQEQAVQGLDEPLLLVDSFAMGAGDGGALIAHGALPSEEGEANLDLASAGPTNARVATARSAGPKGGETAAMGAAASATPLPRLDRKLATSDSPTELAQAESAPFQAADPQPQPGVDRDTHVESFHKQSPAAGLGGFGRESAAQSFFSAAPPTVVVADNRSQVEQEARRSAPQPSLAPPATADSYQPWGRLLIWGGAGLLALVGILLLLRRPIQGFVWIPAVSVAAVCLLIGFLRLVPSQPTTVTSSATIAQVDRTKNAEPAAAMPAAGDENALPAASPPADLQPLGVDPAPAREPMLRMDRLERVEKPGEQPAPGEPQLESAKATAPALSRTAGGNLGSVAEGAPAAGTQVADATADQSRRNLNGAADKAQLPFDTPSAPDASGLPSSLFWRPLTPTDSSGMVTIEFKLPDSPAEYRLLIDAIGAGRLGGEQRLLQSQVPPP
jgi:hypothetical protein